MALVRKSEYIIIYVYIFNYDRQCCTSVSVETRPLTNTRRLSFGYELRMALGLDTERKTEHGFTAWGLDPR